MKSSIVMFIATIGASSLMATQPIQLSLVPNIALFDRTDSIEGLTLSIWGENQQKALGLGLVNGSVGESAGLSIGILNYTENYTGVQWGFANYTQGDFLGWQVAGVNYVEGWVTGLQTGWVNYAGKLTGLQLGFVNYAKASETGIQIGVINLMPENAWFRELPNELAPMMIFVNWHL